MVTKLIQLRGICRNLLLMLIQHLKNEDSTRPFRLHEEGRFSTLRTKITDRKSLKAALQSLGLSVKFDADVRGSNGQRVRADIVAVLEGNYDIGWSCNGDGYFDLIVDLWGVSQKYNQTELINLINQKYSIAYRLRKTEKTNYKSSFERKIQCPRCDSLQTYRYSYQQGKPSHKCGSCGTQFTEP